MTRPNKTEYADYYETYVSLVEEDDILAVLAAQLDELRGTFGPLDEEKAGTAYAPGKWTIKELLGHLIDSERVFAYRALRFARGDRTPIEGFEQDDYVTHGNFNRTPVGALLEELLNCRRANLLMFENLSAEAWRQSGPANGNPVTVRALAYIMAGHIRHHRNVLRERYAV